MKSTAEPAREVLVVLDPDFGDRLREAWQGQPVWITMSAANASVVHALAANAPGHDQLTGITGFRHVEGTTAEDRLLAELYPIDLHHGPYSTTFPYTVLKVIGAQLTPAIRDALLGLGFLLFEQSPDGFVATRSEQAASRIRD